jgi:hypothetical protein
MHCNKLIFQHDETNKNAFTTAQCCCADMHNITIGGGAMQCGRCDSYCNNIAIGYQAMQCGSYQNCGNVALGYQALLQAHFTYGWCMNTAIGSSAMRNYNATASYCGSCTSRRKYNIALGAYSICKSYWTEGLISIGAWAGGSAYQNKGSIFIGAESGQFDASKRR